MKTPSEKEADKRMSSLLSVVERQAANPDRQFLSELQTKSTSEFLTHSGRGARSFEAGIAMWRAIMQNRTTKLGAVAMVIVAASIGLHWLGPAVPAYGITDALKLYEDANVIHMSGWQFLHTGDDTQLEKFPFEIWVDRQNGRLRDWHPVGWFGDYTTETPRYYLTVSDGQYAMETFCYTSAEDNKVHPRVSFTKLSPFQQRLQIRTIEAFPSFAGSLSRVRGFAKTGRERIDDQLVDVWQGELTATGKTVPHQKMKIWLSPSTGRLVRILTWTNAEKDSVRWLPSMDANTIEYGATPPPDCFVTEAPEGHEAVNTKETATEHELGEERGIKFYGCVGFTLEDGSVIYGWHANHNPNESQAHLFENLLPGGPLPNLPAQIVGLKPWPVAEDITCVGRHLAFSRKKGKFYEWGIYVPDRNTPPRDTFEAYRVVRQYNGIEPRRFGGFPNNVEQELVIDSEDEFDMWVRGAMAELSDGAKAPEDVTYRSALKLAEKIRHSLKDGSE